VLRCYVVVSCGRFSFINYGKERDRSLKIKQHCAVVKCLRLGKNNINNCLLFPSACVHRQVNCIDNVCKCKWFRIRFDTLFTSCKAYNMKGEKNGTISTYTVYTHRACRQYFSTYPYNSVGKQVVSVLIFTDCVQRVFA